MPDIAGLPSPPSVMLTQAGLGFECEIMRRTATPSAVLPERADRAIDNARIAGAHGVIADAEPIDRAGTEGLDEHVRGLAQRQQRLALRGILEVDHHALLAAIEIAEEYRTRTVGETDVTAGIALAGRLYLDHLGAVIGHRQRQIRSRQEHAEIDDADAFKFHDQPARSVARASPT